MAAVSLNPAQLDILGQLRGDIEQRPCFDVSLRRSLQDELEDGLRHVEGPLTVNKGMLSKVHQCEGRFAATEEFQWTPARARGTLAHKAIELSAGGMKHVTPARLIDLAIGRICESPETQSLADYLRTIDDAEHAELRVCTLDLIVKFNETFPPLPSHWIVNAEATTAAYVGHRRVVFQGKIDLKLGEITAPRASTLIIDIKTGNPSFADMDDLRFYALLETLRTGVPPFRWANVYVSAGRAESEDVSEPILRSATRRLIDGVNKIAALRGGGAPALSPGSACRLCCARFDCTQSVHMPRREDEAVSDEPIKLN